MKIVGFGDSFILGLERVDHAFNKDHAWFKCYQGMLGDHYNVVPEFRGNSGTGPWNMFFDYLKYPHKDDIDVAIIAWSEITRLYHPKFQPIKTQYCYNEEYLKNASDHERDVLLAMRGYNMQLIDLEKSNYELRALMMMFDEMSLAYPNIKFIHLPCFTWLDQGQWWGNDLHGMKPDQLRYHYDFKNGMEIRPALIYMSILDEWPINLAGDPRECHMTTRVNRLLADSIIECITNYHPGKLIEMDTSLIK